MLRFPIVNLGQVRTFGPINPETMSRLCEAVDNYNWHSGSMTSEGGRIRRDEMANVSSILGPMSLTDRRAAEAQMWFECNNPRPLLDQIPFAQPPPAEMVTPPGTGQYPFYTPEPPPQPPPTYKPVASIDRYIREEPLFPTTYQPEGFTGSEPEPTPTPTPTPTPAPVPTGAAGCWYTPGKGYSWGPRPPGGQGTDIQKQSDCENLMRYDQEIRGLTAVTPQVPVQPQVTEQATDEEARAAVPTQGTLTCPVGSFIDPVTRQCRGSVATGGGGGLINQALTLGPSGGVAASGISLMGRRYPVVNLF